MLGRLLNSPGVDEITKIVTLESMVKELHVYNNICLISFVPLAMAAS